MNQPDRYVQFVLPEGERKVKYKADTKLKDAGTFTFRSEDHTIGNLLRMQLHADKSTVFAGYRIPHPLEPVGMERPSPALALHSPLLCLANPLTARPPCITRTTPISDVPPFILSLPCPPACMCPAR